MSMEHPDFTQGIGEKLTKAREYYLAREVKFTGPDRRTRKAKVTSVIFEHRLTGGWCVMVLFDMERLDGHPDRLEERWAQYYYDVNSSSIEWGVS